MCVTICILHAYTQQDRKVVATKKNEELSPIQPELSVKADKQEIQHQQLPDKLKAQTSEEEEVYSYIHVNKYNLLPCPMGAYIHTMYSIL